MSPWSTSQGDRVRFELELTDQGQVVMTGPDMLKFRNYWDYVLEETRRRLTLEWIRAQKGADPSGRIIVPDDLIFPPKAPPA